MLYVLLFDLQGQYYYCGNLKESETYLRVGCHNLKAKEEHRRTICPLLITPQLFNVDIVADEKRGKRNSYDDHNIGERIENCDEVDSIALLTAEEEYCVVDRECEEKNE